MSKNDDMFQKITTQNNIFKEGTWPIDKSAPLSINLPWTEKELNLSDVSLAPQQQSLRPHISMEDHELTKEERLTKGPF